MTLETLLNKLIELGWKPFWEVVVNQDIPKSFQYFEWRWYITNRLQSFTLNDLCSIDSGMWQFCYNYRKDNWDNLLRDTIIDWKRWDWWPNNIIWDWRPQYRLMLSSIQEDKSKFLLDNIKLPYDTTTDDR